MDSGRLGRVLGAGARHAAKTVVGAVDAATAPSPHPTPRPTPRPIPRPIPAASPASPSTAAAPPRSAPSISGPAAARPTSSPSRTSQPAARRGVVEGGRRFGRAVWEPTVRLSGVLWLEVTGLFFAIFALIAGVATWRFRAAVRVGEHHTEFLLALGMLLMFGYFAVSSFLAASRRSRRR